MCFWTSLSQDSKNAIFVTVRCLEMLQIAVWKNDIINGYGFCAIYLPKIDISTWNSACHMCRYSFTPYCPFFKFWILKKKIYKKLSFSFLGLFFGTAFFGKIRDSSLNELLILRYLVLFICILLLISIFGDFSNIYPFSTKNGMTLDHAIFAKSHLNRHISKRFWEKSAKFCKRRQIDIRRSMPSFASISVTPRTLFKKNRWGRIRPPRRSRVKC